MKTIIIFIMSNIIAICADVPKVEVYLITKFDSKAEVSDLPDVIFEISNTTEKTFYIKGSSIESPTYHVEALRHNRWLRIPHFLCGTGTVMRPLKPGAKMLVTVPFPLEESTARFRFFFFESSDQFNSKVVSVYSRGIEKKELGDLSGTIGELTSDKKLEEILPDLDINKSESKSTDAEDPFAK